MKHELYTPDDFTSEEYYRGNVLAIAVIDGGLGVCKSCGAAEVQLDDFPTCKEYRIHKKQEMEKKNAV
jgi:hypothetical protein